MTASPGTSSAPGRSLLAGLAQLPLLLLAIWAILPRMGSLNYGLAATFLGLSLAPIGWGRRLPWLGFGALAWGAMGLLLTWPRPAQGAGGDGGGAVAVLALVLASAAAVAGQWLNLNQMPLARLGQLVRGLTQLTMAASLFLLLLLLGGGAGVGVALALLTVAVADLALTALTLLLGALQSRRDG